MLSIASYEIINIIKRKPQILVKNIRHETSGVNNKSNKALLFKGLKANYWTQASSWKKGLPTIAHDAGRITCSILLAT